MNQGIVRVLTVLSLLATVVSVGAVPAAAGQYCDTTGDCGYVVNNSDQPMRVAALSGTNDCRVYEPLPPPGSTYRNPCTVKYLAPGDDAGDGTGLFKDVDGFTVTSTHFYLANGVGIDYKRLRAYTYVKIYDFQRAVCYRNSGLATRCVISSVV